MSDKPSEKARVDDALLEARLRQIQRAFLQGWSEGTRKAAPQSSPRAGFIPVEVDDEVLLDDGTFYVTLRQDPRGSRMAAGVLRKRCAVGLHTPFGYDCIGQFSKQPDGQWLAGIDVQSEVGSGVEEYLVVHDVPRMAAIVAMWLSRHNACPRFAGRPEH